MADARYLTVLILFLALSIKPVMLLLILSALSLISLFSSNFKYLSKADSTRERKLSNVSLNISIEM